MQVLVISTPSASKRGEARASMRGHGVGLLQALVGGEIEPARIGDGGDAHAALRLGLRRQPFQPGDAGFAQALGVGHDVRLADRHEIGGVEELADRDLMRGWPTGGQAPARPPAWPAPRR